LEENIWRFIGNTDTESPLISGTFVLAALFSEDPFAPKNRFFDFLLLSPLSTYDSQ